MRAIVVGEWGGADKLELREIAAPRPAAGEVLVRVRAVGVCGRDLIDRRGGHRGAALPAVLGHEFAGEVVEMGQAAEGRQGSPADGAGEPIVVGDRVASLLRSSCGACRACTRGEPTLCENVTHDFGHNVQGAYAELVVAPATALVKIPDGVGYAQAAPLACTAGVALRALRSVGRVEPGETVVITGASGGVGMAAIQIAKTLGARVIAVTGSANKVARLAAIGADDVVVSAGDAFHEEARERTSGGADLALELTGSATFGSALKSLRRGGRLVLVGNIRTEPVKLNPGAVILFGYRILGTSSCSRADLRDVVDLVAQGHLTTVVDRELGFERVAEAHQALADRAVVGRIVLVP